VDPVREGGGGSSWPDYGNADGQVHPAEAPILDQTGLLGNTIGKSSAPDCDRGIQGLQGGCI